MHADCTAQMISSRVELGAAPLFRRQFALDGGHGAVASATLRMSALGVFEAFVNGHPVGDDVLSPGWSAYEWRLRYRSYDVTALLDATTVLAVTVGNGWYRGRLGFTGGRAVYGDRLGLIADLHIVFDDGHVQVIDTDGTWTVGGSDTLADDLYDGQIIDARRRTERWYLPGPDPDMFFPARTVEFDRGTLAPYIGPPVSRHEVLAPVDVWQSPSGRTLVDFGQNIVGWVRCSVQGPAGSEIRVRHAEVLEDDELGTRPLRDAQATDRFIFSGGIDQFEPTKTFHGFRYIEVSGWPGEVTKDSIEAVVVHSEMRRTGSFECSEPLLNKFHDNVVWGTRGNFLDVPTDCPQRNERLGWTGDIAVFAPSAAFLFDVHGFLRDWLCDLALEQRHADGMVAYVVPDPLKRLPMPALISEPESTAIWGDAAVWVPWALYSAYGDLTVLDAQYTSMAAHVRRVETLISPSGLWDRGFQFGDWLDPDAPPHEPWSAKAHPGVVATACLYRSASLVADAADLLGHADDAAHFRALAHRTRAAFIAEYLLDDGTILSDCVTVYTLAIVFGLLDDDAFTRCGERLTELVRKSDHRISTGFAGTPFVTEALTLAGHLEDAYELVLQQECPSWLYSVTMGATTVWERWDSMLPDGSINPGEMTSFNHYALGAVADWLHRVVGGIAPLEPGYASIRIAPRPGGTLTWARTALDTRFGRIDVEWRLEPGGLVVESAVPAGTRALLSLPGCDDRWLEPGHHVHRTERMTR